MIFLDFSVILFFLFEFVLDFLAKVFNFSAISFGFLFEFLDLLVILWVFRLGFPKPILISTLLIQLYDSHVLRPKPNQIDLVKTTEDVQLPKKYKLSPVMKEEEDFELCRNGQDILICFVCGGAQGGWRSTLPHTKSKDGSDCSDAASKLMLSCSLVWLRS